MHSKFVFFIGISKSVHPNAHMSIDLTAAVHTHNFRIVIGGNNVRNWNAFAIIKRITLMACVPYSFNGYFKKNELHKDS